MKGIYVVLIWSEDDFDETTQLLSDRYGCPLTFTLKRAAKAAGKLAAIRRNKDEELPKGEEAWFYRVVELNERGGY